MIINILKNINRSFKACLFIFIKASIENDNCKQKEYTAGTVIH